MVATQRPAGGGGGAAPAAGRAPPMIDNDTGEVLDRETVETGTALAVLGGGGAVVLRAEIDAQVATAHAYPRQLAIVAKAIYDLVILDEVTAGECIYGLPRGGKPIRGPSIRFAEILASQWGNCRISALVTEVNRTEKYVEAEGTFLDLQTNMASKARVRRRIVDSRGRLYNDDMIMVTSNAACAIAKRNAILGGIPKAVWRAAYDKAEGIIRGDVATLSQRRDDAVKFFGGYGVTPEQVFAAIGVAGMEEVTLDHLVTLKGMAQAIRSGEAQVEELFRAPGTVAGSFATVRDPLSDKPAEEKKGDGAPAPEGTAEAGTPKVTTSALAGEQGSDGGADAAQAAGAATAAPAADAGSSPDAGARSEGRDGSPSGAPTEGAGAGEAGSAATAAGPATGGGESGLLPPPSVEAARARGGTAAREGRRRMMPADYKDHPACSAAWFEEFDTVKAELAERRG